MKLDIYAVTNMMLGERLLSSLKIVNGIAERSSLPACPRRPSPEIGNLTADGRRQQESYIL
jgi:hypothetical protein